MVFWGILGLLSCVCIDIWYRVRMYMCSNGEGWGYIYLYICIYSRDV